MNFSLDTYISKADQRKLLLLLLSFVVGIIGGIGAYVFRVLIVWVNNVLFVIPSELTNQSGLITILAPAVGGLFVGLLVNYGAKEAKGHGVPEIVESVNNNNGKMRLRIPFVKIMASAITIGSGGSAGREGPIAQIGGGFGSFLAQKSRLSKDDSKTLVIAGVSAGISATFNAPLGGVLFGYEVIRRDRKTYSIFPLIISSVTGTSVGDILIGAEPAFIYPVYENYNVFSNIHLYILLGIVMGLYSFVWVRGFYFIEDLLEKIKISPILLTGLGGLLIGSMELFFPEVSGITYAPINKAFKLDYAIGILILLTLMKFIATSVSIGSGGSGGVFAPTLFQGVMLGTAFGLIAHSFGLPSQTIGVFSLLGMAALFAGSARAPLTAIIMTSEMVDDFHLILPLMFAVVTSWLISGIVLNEDMYFIKLKRRGVTFMQSVDILDEVLVHDVMVEKPIKVSSKDRIEHIIELMIETSHTGFPVVDNGKLVGVITEHDVEIALNSKQITDWIVDDICTNKIHTVRPECTLSEAFAFMAHKKINRLPVVDEEHNLVGWITRSDIMRVYLNQKKINIAEAYENHLLESLE
ncbi:MAG: chloride channel protein [Candidatus Heimdallarchaeota archaeon]|nr:chloride channel protein [Candidatus Heimdallarchaeota archaeon]